ncbi:MAG TPA: hypothetical protein VI913_04140 [Candidatus Peribacteraceae bacterium]|nr:hypothetical protein [Candidatus Peribacteraceae bacterium]
MEALENRTIYMSLALIILSLAVVDVLWVAQTPLASVTEEPTTTPTPTGGNTEPIVAEPDVPTVLTDLQFMRVETEEFSFLKQVIPAVEANVTSTVLLKDGDRAGSITWVETPRVKIYFFALKEALHDSFTPELQDLRDETERLNETTFRNVLAFRDPGISDERIIFIRIRNRLYEFHIPVGKEPPIRTLMDTLTGWPVTESSSSAPQT